MSRKIALLSLALLLISCGKSASVEEKQASIKDKQISACTEDIQIGLNDPSSFELISAEIIKEDKELNRLEINFTAKNKFGGRERGLEVCGFKSATSAELDPNDHQNQQRQTQRSIQRINQQ